MASTASAGALKRGESETILQGCITLLACHLNRAGLVWGRGTKLLDKKVDFSGGTISFPLIGKGNINDYIYNTFGEFSPVIEDPA